MALVICALLAVAGEIGSAGGQMPSDSAALLQFQRAADSYAFAHRRTERRRDAMPLAAEGTLFTPAVAAAFRSRIADAVKSGCEWPRSPADNFVVPAVNTYSGDAPALPECLGARLPRLPEELEYRAAGAALLLSDRHLKVVVDVLHAAHPRTGDN
ncbi:MAG TPA: hypothetical protein VNT81_07930 [Vicinamibacterales bacterium]|nr:hypothetical protein [Vicinamibacterales bacterium]